MRGYRDKGEAGEIKRWMRATEGRSERQSRGEQNYPVTLSLPGLPPVSWSTFCTYTHTQMSFYSCEDSHWHNAFPTPTLNYNLNYNKMLNPYPDPNLTLTFLCNP